MRLLVKLKAALIKLMIGYFNPYFNRYLKTAKQKTYIELVWTFFLLIILLLFPIRLTFATILDLNQKLREGNKVNTELDSKLANLAQAQNSYTKVKTDLDLLDSALPGKPLILNLLNSVNQIALADNLSLSDLNYQEAKVTTAIAGTPFDPNSRTAQSVLDVGSFPFVVKGSGDYLNIRKFINDLEKFDRIIQIQNFDLGKGEDKTALDFSVGGQAFWLDSQTTAVSK